MQLWHIFAVMAVKKKKDRKRITERDYIKAQRRASRLEEIEAHGKPVSFRPVVVRSKKVYDRKRVKREDF